MNRIIKHIAKQLLIISIPLGGLYLFAQHAFAENRKREHPTDVGLGIAILLFLILIALFIYFTINSIIKYRKREYKPLIINCVFLTIFTIPILNIHCLMGSELFFCDELLNFTNELF